MAELVDAADSKSAVRKDVQVRFLFWAQNLLFRRFFYTAKPVKTVLTGNTSSFHFLLFDVIYSIPVPLLYLEVQK